MVLLLWFSDACFDTRGEDSRGFLLNPLFTLQHLPPVDPNQNTVAAHLHPHAHTWSQFISSSNIFLVKSAANFESRSPPRRAQHLQFPAAHQLSASSSFVAFGASDNRLFATLTLHRNWCPRISRFTQWE